MKTLAAFALTLLASCSAQQVQESFETLGDALVVAGGAAAGTAVGGPAGGAAGATIAYQSIEVAEGRTENGELEDRLSKQHAQRAIDVEAARSLGYQQGADNAAAMVALIKGDPELSKFFQEKARESAEPLRAQMERVRQEALSEAALQAARRWKWTIILVGVLVLLYIAKQYWWTKKQDRRYLRLDPTALTERP